MEDLAAISAAIAHRGPDGEGCYVDGMVGLIHRRLSIIDLSETGRQPMLADGGRLALTYNGEIYNYRELRRELEAGWVFRSRSDTEVLLAAYDRWGPSFLDRVNGIYAFALYDRARRSVLLARDRFGVKPLFLCNVVGGISFCSEIKGLLTLSSVSRNVSLRSLHEFLYYGAPLGQNTMFCGIESILPGERREIGLDGEICTVIEDMVQVACASPDAGSLGSHELRDLIRSAVERQMVADVPVAVLLSGGIDSSTLVAFASDMGRRSLTTYAIDFKNSAYGSELPKARQVARRFNTDHHEVTIDPTEAIAVIEELVDVYDGPFSDAANIPLYLLFRRIAKSHKVVLQGDGGDEVFGGYRRYSALRILPALSPFVRMRRMMETLLPQESWPRWDRIRRFHGALCEPDVALRMAMLLTVETRHPSPIRLLSPALRAEMRLSDPFSRYRKVSSGFGKIDEAQRMLWTDCRILLPDIFLTKVDRAAMANGIEARVPLLDEELCKRVLQQPASSKISFGVSKYCLRRAMKGILPPSIVWQRKSGFGVPYGQWLRDPLRDFMLSTLNDRGSVVYDVFDRPALDLCIKNHITGRSDQSFLLWKMVNLAIWLKRSGVSI